MVNLLISCGVFMNLATNHFSILNLTNSHRGLNTPKKHLLKLQQVLVGENPSIKPQSTIMWWSLMMKFPPHQSSEPVEWLSPQKGQQAAGTLHDSTRWYRHHQTPSFWVKNGSLVPQQHQQDGRLSRALTRPWGHLIDVAIPPKHLICDQYHGDN